MADPLTYNSFRRRLPCGLFEDQTCSRSPCPCRASFTGLPPMPVYAVSPPLGCICPPGANKDCETPFCPRKPVRAT